MKDGYKPSKLRKKKKTFHKVHKICTNLFFVNFVLLNISYIMVHDLCTNHIRPGNTNSPQRERPPPPHRMLPEVSSSCVLFFYI